MAFWGVEVKPGKPYTHLHDDSRGRLRLSQATLGNGKSNGRSILQCNVGEKSPILLCSLIPEKAESCHLELEFEEFNDEVVFSVLGQRSVHLSGYYLGASSRSAGGEDESESYGEDIAETESDYSGSYNSEGYESDFIDDEDIEMYPSSPTRKSNVVIEEIVEDDEPVNGNPGRRRGKKNQVSDSDDNDSQRQIVKHTGSTVVESEDEDGFPIFSLRNKKPVDDGNAKTLSEDKKRKIDSLSPEAEAASGTANKNEKSKKKKKGKIEDEKPLETICKSSTVELVSANENQVLVDKLDDHNDEGVQSMGVNDENTENDLAVKNEVIGNENDVKLRKKKKERVKKGKKSENGVGHPGEKRAEEVEKCGLNEAINDETMAQDLPSEANKLPTEKQVVDSSIPSDATPVTSGKKKKKTKKKGNNTQEKEHHGEMLQTEDNLDSLGKEPSNSQDDRKMNEDSLTSKQLNDNTLIVNGDPFLATKQKNKKKKNSENDSNINKELPGDISEQKEKAQPKKTRTFPNGFIVEELSMGKPDGKRASRGCKVSVKYVGKIQNGVEFDSSGKKPFTFRLGIGEVIKGWDIGVEGMRVGDKRKLTVPPSLGYGSKAIGKIPANSWLVFDVELVSVK